MSSDQRGGVDTRMLPVDGGIDAAVEVLRSGGVVALPTETVYGLGAVAWDAAACARIFEVKERPLSDPLIVHLPEAAALSELAVANGLALRLAEAFWPGPLTLVLPSRAGVPDLVTAGQETVAVRVSAHPGFQEVIRALDAPIAAPSANRFGRISPTSAEAVKRELGGRIPLILDGGPCPHGLESTIVRVTDAGMETLRPGPITREQLAAFGELLAATGQGAVPGGMKSHYAPRTPLEILGDREPVADGSRRGLLSWTRTGEGFGAVEVLSSRQDLREAAANLYGAMRRLDEAGLDRILAEPVPEVGLGVAIMDRLRKAATST